MLKLAKRFVRHDQQGNVAITFALALLPMMGMVGAGVDYSRLSLTRAKLQSVADAAALAGAMAMYSKASEIASVQEAAATTAATAVADGQAPSAQETVTATATEKSVTVKLTQTENLIFGGFLGTETSLVSATSTAAYNIHKPCIIVLEASANAVLMNSSANLNSNCKIHVNSTSNTAIQLNTTSKIKAQSTCVVGSVFLNGGTIEPAAKTGCAKLDDPLKNLPDPVNATNPCQYTNTVIPTGTSQTLTPDVYCNKFDVNGGTATLSPGIYIIRDVDLVVNQQGKLLGQNVMLFFMGKGRLVLNSDSILDLSGRTSGTYTGMLFFQSRDPSTLGTAPFIVNGSGSMKTEGTIYLPNGSIQFNDSGITNLSSAWTVIVVRALHLNSSAKVLVNTNYGGGPALPSEVKELRSPEGVRLIN